MTPADALREIEALVFAKAAPREREPAEIVARVGQLVERIRHLEAQEKTLDRIIAALKPT